MLLHMAREVCQPVRQTSSLPGPTDGSVGHVSRGAQKAQIAFQQSPDTASVCEGLVELGSCDRVPRNNRVEADKRFRCLLGRGITTTDIFYFDVYMYVFMCDTINRMLC